MFLSVIVVAVGVGMDVVTLGAFERPEIRTDQHHGAAGEGEAESEVALSLDTEGHIAGVYAADRPRSATPPLQPTPWRGSFSDYRYHAGRWLPFAGEVGWEVDGVEQVYWRGTLLAWKIA